MKKILRRNDYSRNSTNSSFTMRRVRYVECQRNHAASVGGYVIDGCREYMPEGTTSGTLNCAACGCHRNFHRREVETDVASECTSASSTTKWRSKFNFYVCVKFYGNGFLISLFGSLCSIISLFVCVWIRCEIVCNDLHVDGQEYNEPFIYM